MENKTTGGMSLDDMASRLHQVYQDELKKQGKESKHSDFFTELPKDIADLDRALAKYVFKLLEDRDNEWREKYQKTDYQKGYEKGIQEVLDKYEEAFKTIVNRQSKK